MAREDYLSRDTTRDGVNSAHYRKYHLDTQTTSSAVAMQELLQALPNSVSITWPESPTGLLELDQFAPRVVPKGAGFWYGEATYRHKASNAASNQNTNLAEVDDTEISLNLGTESTTLTEAIAQSRFAYVYKDENGNEVSNPAPDVGNAINSTREGTKGVSIMSPAGSLQYTKVFSNKVITETAWVRDRAEHRCKMNSAAFLGFEPGELLFTQMSLSVRNSGDVSVTFSFSQRPNQTNLHIGPTEGNLGTTVPNKKGWEYVWVRYTKSDDGTTVTNRPEGVYLAQTYEEYDFNLLIE